MSGAHTHSAEDMRSLSHLMAIVHVPQLEKKKVEAPDPAADIYKNISSQRGR